MKASAILIGAAVLAASITSTVARDMNTRGTAPQRVGPQASTTAPSCDDCYAVVLATGVLDRGRYVRSVRRLRTGTYDIRFRNEFEFCSWQGTIGNPDFVGTQPASMISITGRFGTNDGLFVQTFNAAGTLTDRSFHVVIVC